MQDQPTPPAWGTPAHTAQRLVLLELMLAPPDIGDDPEQLARILELDLEDVHTALEALEAAGLAETRDGLAFATAQPLYVEALLPARLWC